jgi:hypothetical protein
MSIGNHHDPHVIILPAGAAGCGPEPAVCTLQAASPVNVLAATRRTAGKGVARYPDLRIGIADASLVILAAGTGRPAC